MSKLINLDAYKLKWVAIVGMVLSHMVITWWEIIPMWLSFLLFTTGGLTFPIMAFFLVEGYKHTSNLKRYMLRLFILGLIAMPFHILALKIPLGYMYPWLNILFSMILSLIVLVLYDRIKIRALFWLMYVVLIVPISFLFFEWHFIGITMVLLFHIIRNENVRRTIPPIFAGVCWFFLASLSGMIVDINIIADIIRQLSPALFSGTISTDQGLIANADFMMVAPTFAIGCILAAFLLKNYNGEHGKGLKWLFYVIYPLHFAVLAAVALALGLISLDIF